MNDININISKEDALKFGGIIVGVAVLVYAYLYFFWIPNSKKMEEMRNKIKQIDAEIRKAEQVKAKFKNLEATLKELEAQRIDIEKKIPKDKDITGLMHTLKEIADRYNIQLVSVNPGATVKEQYFFRVTYSLNIRGSYHNIGRFLADISLQKRIMNVENVVIAGSGDELTATFTLITYMG